MAITADGALMVISNMVTCTMAVYRLPEGVLVSEFGGEGEGPGEFNSPYQLCLTPSGTLLVADGDNHQIQVSSRHFKFVFMSIFPLVRRN